MQHGAQLPCPLCGELCPPYDHQVKSPAASELLAAPKLSEPPRAVPAASGQTSQRALGAARKRLPPDV